MSNHRYGRQFNIVNSNLHLLLRILLAGDIATNPDPAKSRRIDNNSLEVLYLNARSVKSFVSTDNITARKVCKITLLQFTANPGLTWLSTSLLWSIFACCSTLFSKPPTYIYTVKMTESDHKKAYQEYLKEKTFRTVVVYLP